MAIGIARMFNLRFPANFNSPYKAQSVIEYWQRWHMTLTRYLTLYLYNPISLWVTRRRAVRGLAVHRQAQASPGGFATMVLLPTFVTMAVAGVWHGSGITFLVFGLLHAVYLSVNHAWQLLCRRPRGTACAAIAGRITLTYGCVLIGAVLFRSPSLRLAGQVLAAMLGLHGVVPLRRSQTRTRLRALLLAAWLAGLYAIVWGAPNTQQIMRPARPTLEAVAAGPLAWLRLATQPGLGGGVRPRAVARRCVDRRQRRVSVFPLLTGECTPLYPSAATWSHSVRRARWPLR